MNNKKQWQAPTIKDLDLENTLGGSLPGSSENSVIES